MTNWEALNILEKIKVTMLEKLMLLIRSRRIAYKIEIRIYKTYRNALLRKQNILVSE